MSSRGSDRLATPRLALPAWLTPILVGLGVVGMILGAVGARGAGLGLRATLLSSETGLVLPSILALLVAGIPVLHGLGVQAIGARVLLLSLLAGGSLWMVSIGLMTLQSLIWPPSQEFLDQFKALHDALRPRGPLDAILSVMAIAVVPALCEEVVFRGVVLPAFERRRGSVVAVIVSALLFSSIHLDFSSGALYRIPFTFVVGVAMGSLRVFTGSLVPCVAAHATFNTITFLTVLLSGATSQAMDEPSAAVGLPLLAAGCLLTVLSMRPLRRPLM